MQAVVKTSVTTATPPAGLDWYPAVLARVNTAIAAHLKTVESSIGTHSRLADAVKYSLGLSGKRFRPVLVLECGRICGGREEAVLPAAIAVECIHTFSLIHDDLPAMDDDELRRGKPCNHKVFGEAMAILAGDWLAAHPFSLLLSAYPTETGGALARTLADGALDMVAGQGADVEGEDQPTQPALVEFIHLHKTARLIEASCRMGALCADADSDKLAALGHFGRHLGMAFQITDDLLDATGTTEKVGKRVGKDAAAAKQTYPAAFGVERSSVRAGEEIDAALGALESFGAAGDHLRSLARYVIARDR